MNLSWLARSLPRFGPLLGCENPQNIFFEYKLWLLIRGNCQKCCQNKGNIITIIVFLGNLSAASSMLQLSTPIGVRLDLSSN